MAARAALLDTWLGQVAALRDAAGRLTPNDLATGLPGEPWTVAQIVFHTAAGLTYPRDLHEIAVSTGQMTSVDLRIYDPPGDEGPDRHELLALIDTREAATIAYLGALSDEAFFSNTPVIMPGGNRYFASIPTLLDSSIDHQRGHLRQVEKWLARGSARGLRAAGEP